jgi:3-methyladenine DNA glycosylase AlkD
MAVKSSSKKMESALKTFVQERLVACRDAGRAQEMAAYMKSSIPFYGVPKPERLPIIRAFKKEFVPESFAQYESNVLALWDLPHREEKYLALNYAEMFPQFITVPALPLYERLVREGAWWDYVDPIASHLVGKVLLDLEKEVRPLVNGFVGDEDFWIRRTALLSHLGHKERTSSKHLFDYCLKLAHEKEFFVRKAIGWSLREYSKSCPELVREFLLRHSEKLSPLSFKEGAKYLVKIGVMPELNSQ